MTMPNAMPDRVVYAVSEPKSQGIFVNGVCRVAAPVFRAGPDTHVPAPRPIHLWPGTRVLAQSQDEGTMGSCQNRTLRSLSTG